MIQRVAAHLILGCTGAGKTTLIRGLIAQRPADERWAVMINDFGMARFDAQHGMVLREVAGCMCCTGQVALRVALVQLLHATRLQRVFIEASAAARPAALLALLAEPGIASAIDLRPVICVIDPRQLADERFNSREDYRGQMAAADIMVVNRRSGVSAAESAPLQGQALMIESDSGSIALATIA